MGLPLSVILAELPQVLNALGRINQIVAPAIVPTPPVVGDGANTQQPTLKQKAA